MGDFMCIECEYIYNPSNGDPDGGIEPGTPFDQIPEDDRTCPVCGTDKASFSLLD